MQTSSSSMRGLSSNSQQSSFPRETDGAQALLFASLTAFWFSQIPRNHPSGSSHSILGLPARISKPFQLLLQSIPEASEPHGQIRPQKPTSQYQLFCLGQLSIAGTKYQTDTIKKNNCLFWLMISPTAARSTQRHHGRELLISQQQEAERREGAREEGLGHQIQSSRSCPVTHQISPEVCFTCLLGVFQTHQAGDQGHYYM